MNISQGEFDSLYQSAKYSKFGLDDDYIGDSTVKSSVVIAMYEQLSAMTKRAEEAEDSARSLKVENVLLRSRAESDEQHIRELQEPELSDGAQYSAMSALAVLKLNEELQRNLKTAITENKCLSASCKAMTKRAEEADVNLALAHQTTDFWVRENADLTMKLAEQQAALFTVRAILSDCSASDAIKAVAHIQKHFADNHAELNKLLSEARSQAVPEDSARLDFVLKNSAFIMQGYADAGGNAVQLLTQNEDEEYVILHNADSFFKTERDAIDAAMLAAAPKP